MINSILTKVIGSKNERMLKRLQSLVRTINDMEPEIQALTDEQLRAKKDEFRARLAEGAELDDLLPEAFAVVREAGVRVLSMRHFDVQLIGGIILHRGIIAEMKTGEGKTLVATLPVYLNALTGTGGPCGHRQRLSGAGAMLSWMGQIYQFLGLSVGMHCAWSRG